MGLGAAYGAGGASRREGGGRVLQPLIAAAGRQPQGCPGYTGGSSGVHPAALGLCRRVGFLELPIARGQSRGWCGAEAGMRHWGCYGAQLQFGERGAQPGMLWGSAKDAVGHSRGSRRCYRAQPQVQRQCDAGGSTGGTGDAAGRNWGSGGRRGVAAPSRGGPYLSWRGRSVPAWGAACPGCPRRRRWCPAGGS